MPKTVTLSDSELAALQAIRQVVADTQHPTRPDGHRCSMTTWRSDWPMTDIGIPAGQDLVLELRRPTGSPVLQWHIEAGDPGHHVATVPTLEP